MKTKNSITIAVLSIFSLSILFPACTKYVEKEKIVEKEIIKEKVIRLCTREQAIQMAQEHKNKGTVVPEKDHPNDNRHKPTDIYISQDHIDYRFKSSVLDCLGTVGFVSTGVLIGSASARFGSRYVRYGVLLITAAVLTFSILGTIVVFEFT
jgi:hypothetical protein